MVHQQSTPIQEQHLDRSGHIGTQKREAQPGREHESRSSKRMQMRLIIPFPSGIAHKTSQCGPDSFVSHWGGAPPRMPHQ